MWLSVHPNIIFQIPQPTFIIVDEGFGVFAIRESYQIAVTGFVKADDSGKPGPSRPLSAECGNHTRGADIQIHGKNLVFQRYIPIIATFFHNCKENCCISKNIRCSGNLYVMAF